MRHALRALSTLSTYERAFLIAVLFGYVATWGGCGRAATTAKPRTAPAIYLDAERYPSLLEALQAQRPHLLSARGGPQLVLIVNGGMPEPLENLANIPTSWVVHIERRSSDSTQVGSVATLRVTLRTHSRETS